MSNGTFGEIPPHVITVADYKAHFRALQPHDQEGSPAICVGGKRLPEDGKVRLADLNIDVSQPWQYCSPEEYLACCTEAEFKRKPPVKLGLEKYLTLWILLAVAVGLGVGQIPGIRSALHAMKVGNTNILTAIGMIVMLLPPFAAVKYDELFTAIRTIPKRLALGSLLMNWAVGPFMMLFVGLATLSEHADLLQGVMYIGTARCIAMVLVWTAIAGGDQFLCVSLVLLNSVITVITYAPVVTLLGIVARALGADVRGDVSFMTVLRNVLVYLGIPLVLGAYFILMFFLSWAVAKLLRANSAQTITFAFTAASNNFELALAACTAIFGTSSNQAVATVLGPLLEIPVMLALVKVAQCLAGEEEEQET